MTATQTQKPTQFPKHLLSPADSDPHLRTAEGSPAGTFAGTFNKIGTTNTPPNGVNVPATDHSHE